MSIASYYSDPFYRECRAYGQIQKAIKAKKLRPNVAVPCHGFLFLHAEDEKALRERDIDLGLNKVDLRFQRGTAGRCRARAIVKDLGTARSGVDDKSLVKILSGISTLNKCKVYNTDIRSDNYSDGQIIDFGSSWTEPHPYLNKLTGRQAKGIRNADRVRFDGMVRDEEIPNVRGIGAMPNREYKQKLRQAGAR